MKKRWFASLRHGIGWRPATWQGWGIVTLYVGFLIWDFLRIDSSSNSISDTLIAFTPEFLITTVILSFICYFTGEKPKI
ncbi:MAG TPA: hypothetical protein PKA38_01260 [Candidatus Levybacteria bacterium]|nr:hypothetical protein [Candidatus Levybacteria bacterium]